MIVLLQNLNKNKIITKRNEVAKMFVQHGSAPFKYGMHVLAAVIVLMLVFFLPQTRGSSWLYWTVALLSLAIVFQLGFSGVISEAQKCAKPSEPENLPWQDNSTLWYRDPFFAILVLAGLLYGLCLF